MNYHRVFIENSFVFVTIVTSKRRTILIENINLLRESFKRAINNYNFKIYAICVLPEHIHMIINPHEIKDYPNIIKQIKTFFSKNIDIDLLKDYELSKSNVDKKERDIWQRRYFEHTIISQNDLNKHTDYIHFNPYKHGYVKSVNQWKYSSFNKFVKNGLYEIDWCNFEDKNKILKIDLE